MKQQQHGNIELHIKELVLHGFPRHERFRIGEAIRQELLRQLTEQGIPDGLTRQAVIPRVNADPVHLGQGGRPERLGIQVAQAVYGSVAGGRQAAYDTRASSPGYHSQTNNGGLTTG